MFCHICGSQLTFHRGGSNAQSLLLCVTVYPGLHSIVCLDYSCVLTCSFSNHVASVNETVFAVVDLTVYWEGRPINSSHFRFINMISLKCDRDRESCGLMGRRGSEFGRCLWSGTLEFQSCAVEKVAHGPAAWHRLARVTRTSAASQS